MSYIWDSIINRAHEGSIEYEKVARELARPDRFERRYLSKAYVDAQIRAESNTKYDAFRRTIAGSGVTYCFVFGDDPNWARENLKFPSAATFIDHNEPVNHFKQ